MPACEEIAMADPEDRMQPDGAPPDDRPRRQPPIIEGEAVEISGPPPSAAERAGHLLSWIQSFLPSRRLLAAVAASILAVVIAAVSWIYLVSDGTGGAPQVAGRTETVPSGDAAGRASGAAPAETAGRPATAAAGSGNQDARREITELESRLAAADAAVAALSERVAILDRVVRESGAAARAATERADRALRQLDETRKSGDEQEAAQRLDRGALDDLASRTKALESRQMTVRQIQERLDRLAGAAGSPDKAVRTAVVAVALRNAVERDGRPFTAELAAARTLGLDEAALAALEPFAATGMPRRHELFRDLTALLPEFRRASTLPAQDLGYLDRLQAGAVRMLNIRPAKDEPGDDPPTVLRRIELKMVQEDVDAIITELEKLPAQAKELAQPWRARAAARRDAVEAARILAAASLAKLGEAAAGGATSGSAPQ
jgi:hypothetical protein